MLHLQLYKSECQKKCVLKSHFTYSLVLLLSVVGIYCQDVPIDDFSCPDELEGYYPHLYR